MPNKTTTSKQPDTSGFYFFQIKDKPDTLTVIHIFKDEEQGLMVEYHGKVMQLKPNTFGINARFSKPINIPVNFQ